MSRPQRIDRRPVTARVPSRFACLVAACASALLPLQTLAANFIFSNPAGGDLNASSNYLPPGVPGAADTVTIQGLSDNIGFMNLYVAANQSIGTIAFNHFAPNTIDAKLNGSTPYVLTLAQGQLNFTDSITQTPGGSALTSLFINAPIAGAAGLNKTGVGYALLSGVNTYTGGTTIVGTPLADSGLAVAADNNLGASGSSIFLTDGGTLRTLASFTSARAISINGAAGGRIESVGDLVLNGNISGNGPLTVARHSNGSVTFGGTISANNPLTIANGNTVFLTGRSDAAITVAGTLNLGRPTVGAASNALSDSATLSLRGGNVNVYALSTSTNESAGTLAIDAGASTINLEPTVNGGVQLSFAGVTRQNRSTLFVRGRDLGTGALAANRGVIQFTNTSGLPLVGGGGTIATNDSIVPFILGNANATGGMSPASVVDAGFVTIGANGLRPLDATDYATSLTSGATNNVRLTNGSFTQNTAATVNSLLIRDTSLSSGNTGVGGNGLLTITSGAIAAVSDIAGEELFIDNPIQFGSAEAIVHTAPTSDGHSLLILRGALAGSNGLTKAGAGDLYLENTNSSLAGNITVNGGIVAFTGSAPASGNSSLGNGGTIVINPGATANGYVGLRSTTPLANVARNIQIQQTNTDNSLALLGTFGGYGTNYSGPISIGGGFLNLLGDVENDFLTLSGTVSGAGGLQDPNVATPLPQYLRVTGNNSFGGGTVIRAGRWEVGSNTALGTGTVYFDGNGQTDPASQTGAIQSFGARRTLANPLVFRATPVFTGALGLTFSGSVDLGSVARDIYVNTNDDVTFSGIVSRGGLTKRGTGMLILAGANNYNGQTVIAQGTLRAAHNTALGQATGLDGQATYIVNNGILELSGVNSAESIYFGADLLPITAASPTGNLRSIAGNNTLTSAVAFDNVGTVGVDAGSTLTLAGDTLDATTGGNAVLRKVGAGQLNVKNARLSGLSIDAGTVRITPAGAPTGTSRVKTLTIATGAALDLTNNSLILDYDGASPQPSIIAALAAGRIGTSVATSGAAVGYAEATALFPGGTFPQSYAGQAFDATTLILTQTLKGDANLDRIVNFGDLLALAQNYGGTSGKTWITGDFDYNGTVDFNDLLVLAQNYGASAVYDESALIAAAGANFAADWALAQSMVPEPTTLLALAALPLARRRRR